MSIVAKPGFSLLCSTFLWKLGSWYPDLC